MGGWGGGSEEERGVGGWVPLRASNISERNVAGWLAGQRCRRCSSIHRRQPRLAGWQGEGAEGTDSPATPCQGESGRGRKIAGRKIVGSRSRWLCLGGRAGWFPGGGLFAPPSLVVAAAASEEVGLDPLKWRLGQRRDSGVG